MFSPVKPGLEIAIKIQTICRLILLFHKTFKIKAKYNAEERIIKIVALKPHFILIVRLKFSFQGGQTLIILHDLFVRCVTNAVVAGPHIDYICILISEWGRPSLIANDMHWSLSCDINVCATPFDSFCGAQINSFRCHLACHFHAVEGLRQSRLNAH